MSIKINDAPTDQLIDQPLDPCTNPWMTARRVQLTGLWKPEDVERIVRHVLEQEQSTAYLSDGSGSPMPYPEDELIRLLMVNSGRFELFLSNVEVNFPSRLRDCWKRLPVVHLQSPLIMSYRTGIGALYYIEYVHELIDGERLVPQSEGFVEFAQRLRTWLSQQFTSERGHNCIDNPSEYARLRGGW